MTSKTLRSVVCLLLLFGILATPALAANKNRIGTAGAQELLIPVGARGIAIGPSSSLFAKGVDAIYWNPAGLSSLNGVEAMFSTMTYIADINVAYGAIGVKVGDVGTLGFSIKSLNFGDIPRTTVAYPDGTGEMYSPQYMTLGVTYARQLTDRIGVGVTGYLVSEKILNMSASGVAFDVGVSYKNLGIQGLMLSVGIKAIGPNMKFDGSDAYVTATALSGQNRGDQFYKTEMAGVEMPTNLEIALGYTRAFDEYNAISVGGQFRNNNYMEDEYALGGEYSFQNTVFLRGGYTMSPQTDQDLTGARGYIYDFSVGLGFKADLVGLALSFDYAYRHMKYFDGSQALSIGITF
jgi:hypothetical protein